MLLVALTGGIGSGKSLAGDFFHSLGAIVADADQFARAGLERGSVGFDEVVKRFGDLILRAGQIDRRKLADIVFSDKKARLDLQAIVHPFVKESLNKIIAAAHENDVVIYQIPLLYETKSASRFDRVITVESDEEKRYARLREKGMKDYEISKRMAAQASRAERESIADFILINNGDKDQLMREVENLWDKSLLPLINEKH